MREIERTRVNCLKVCDFVAFRVRAPQEVCEITSVIAAGAGWP